MTTAASEPASAHTEIWDDLLRSFAAKASPRAVAVSFRAAPDVGEAQEPQMIQWLEATTKALNRLPWHKTNLPDGIRQTSPSGRIPPKPEVAAELLWLLLNAPRGQHHRSHRNCPDIQGRSSGRVARRRN